MLHLCIFCQKFFQLRTIYQNYLCGHCQDVLYLHRIRKGPFSFGNDLSCLSLFSYSHRVSELIVKAKVGRDYRALGCLTYMALWRTETHLLANWADWVMPAPSSLTSRLRGSFDIADTLARHIANECPVKYRPSPFFLGWSRKKRATSHVKKWDIEGLKKEKDRIRSGVLFKLGSAKHYHWLCLKPKVLVIDDVFTSGFTLSLLREFLPEARIRVLTIARVE